MIVENLGQVETLRLCHCPTHLAGSDGRPPSACLPGTDAQKIGLVGSIRRFDKLPLQRRQRFGVFADQQRIHQVEHVLALRLG